MACFGKYRNYRNCTFCSVTTSRVKYWFFLSFFSVGGQGGEGGRGWQITMGLHLADCSKIQTMFFESLYQKGLLSSIPSVKRANVDIKVSSAGNPELWMVLWFKRDGSISEYSQLHASIACYQDFPFLFPAYMVLSASFSQSFLLLFFQTWWYVPWTSKKRLLFVICFLVFCSVMQLAVI